jgi:hypothetical protein
MVMVMMGRRIIENSEGDGGYGEKIVKVALTVVRTVSVV